MKTLFTSLLLLTMVLPAAVPTPSSSADEYRILPLGAGRKLYWNLMAQMEKQYEERRAIVDQAVQSKATVIARRELLRGQFRTMLGPFPKRTPLEAKTVGHINVGDYRIEKVLYQSRPGHHITSNLYLPSKTKDAKPVPGVLIPCGHTHDGKASELYQSAAILLAKNGIVALVFDPIGQGERLQFPDSKQHGTTTHGILHLGAVLTGINTGNYRTWDCMRSLDYLASRKEVDPQRLGCTGSSGGGTMTTWMMAHDDRIVAAAPACFITTQRSVFNTIAPPDGEQLYPYQGAYRIDQSDFITMRAPKPTIILAAEQDFFDIEGTREAYRDAQAIYKALGEPDQVEMFTANDGHGFTKPRREAMVAFMRKHLLGKEGSIVEPKLTIQSEDALQVSRTGQVVRDQKDEVTVADLNLQRAKRLASAREAFWKENDQATCLAEVRRLIGLQGPRGQISVKQHGTIERDGYQINKLVIHQGSEPPVPCLLFLPKRDTNKDSKPLPVTIYLDGRGKGTDAGAGGPIEKLVKSDRIVLSLDVRGYGEMANPGGNRRYYQDEYCPAMLALHVGRPLLGGRVEDLQTALAVLQSREDVDATQIELIGIDRAGPVALHAAAIDRRFAKVRLQDSITSWVDDVVAKPEELNLIGHVVPGALMKYDLPDLVRVLGERVVKE